MSIESTLKLELMGDGQPKQHGGAEHEEVTPSSVYFPAGQCAAISNSADSRPSEKSIETTQLLVSVLPPKIKGPQIKDISDLEVFNTVAVSVICLEDDADLKSKLLFRKAGKIELEKNVF